MPDNNQPPQQQPPPSFMGPALGRFADEALRRFFGFGDIPEEEKANILDNLGAMMAEILTINRYFATGVWEEFHNKEGELTKRATMCDYIRIWTRATLQYMAEEEDAAEDDGDEGGGGDEPGDGDGSPDSGTPVIEADFKEVE